jgi:hypothetical protein
MMRMVTEQDRDHRKPTPARERTTIVRVIMQGSARLYR